LRFRGLVGEIIAAQNDRDAYLTDVILM